MKFLALVADGEEASVRVLSPSPLPGNSAGISPAGLARLPVFEIKPCWRKATIK